jgi:hypothetical protein
MQGGVPMAHREVNSIEDIKDKDGKLIKQNLVSRDFQFTGESYARGG